MSDIVSHDRMNHLRQSSWVRGQWSQDNRFSHMPLDCKTSAGFGDIFSEGYGWKHRNSELSIIRKS